MQPAAAELIILGVLVDKLADLIHQLQEQVDTMPVLTETEELMAEAAELEQDHPLVDQQ